jgi:hypothetical protein
MLIRAWVQKEKRPDYESAAWQPEPELAQPPPRSISFSAFLKFFGGLMLFTCGLTICIATMPSLKHAYLTSYGVSTSGTVQQRYRRKAPKGWDYVYFLVVRYETPSGWQSAEIQTSESYYARNFQGQSVPVHYLTRYPSQCVLDDEPYPASQVLFSITLSVAVLGLLYYNYRKIRAVAANGRPVKGQLTKITKRSGRWYLTVYYEWQGSPYEGTTHTNRGKVEWQVGTVVTLLATDPSSNPARPHVVIVYPASEFKINP